MKHTTKGSKQAKKEHAAAHNVANTETLSANTHARTHATHAHARTRVHKRKHTQTGREWEREQAPHNLLDQFDGGLAYLLSSYHVAGSGLATSGSSRSSPIQKGRFSAQKGEAGVSGRTKNHENLAGKNAKRQILCCRVKSLQALTDLEHQGPRPRKQARHNQWQARHRPSRMHQRSTAATHVCLPPTGHSPTTALCMSYSNSYCPSMQRFTSNGTSTIVFPMPTAIASHHRQTIA